MNLNSSETSGYYDDGSQGLNPLPPKARIAILRSHGVLQLEREDSSENQTILASREECGCFCIGICVPESCSCSMAGIECCVETSNGPCGCAGDVCSNQYGRRTFNREEVDIHLVSTILRTVKIDNEELQT